jgi:hypothetical protein
MDVAKYIVGLIVSAVIIALVINFIFPGALLDPWCKYYYPETDTHTAGFADISYRGVCFRCPKNYGRSIFYPIGTKEGSKLTLDQNACLKKSFKAAIPYEKKEQKPSETPDSIKEPKHCEGITGVGNGKPFYDAVLNRCFVCPAGFEQNVFASAEADNKCSKGGFIGIGGELAKAIELPICEPGHAFVAGLTRKCVKCKSGYIPRATAINQVTCVPFSSSPIPGVSEILSCAATPAKPGYSAPFYDPFTNKCWSCPLNHNRNANPIVKVNTDIPNTEACDAPEKGAPAKCNPVPIYWQWLAGKPDVECVL